MHVSPLTSEVVAEVARTVRPRLSDRRYLRRSVAVTQDKGGGHLAHQIDQDAEMRLFTCLESQGFAGCIFSEEAGQVRFGNADEFLVSDPYCNTSLTFRGIRESAITLYRFDHGGSFLDGAIADMQVPRLLEVFAESGSICWDDGTVEPAVCSEVSCLEEATIVVSLLKRARRTHSHERLLKLVSNLLTVDGGIVSLRICAGEVDGFVDAKTGQPAYEALAYRLVEYCGGIVTDGNGRPVDWSSIVSELQDGHVRRQTIIAACTASLHEDICRNLDHESH